MSTLGTLPSHKRRPKTPSFSSILLDSIYRSFDTPTATADGSSYSRNPPPPPTGDASSPTKLSYYCHKTFNYNDKINFAKQRRSKMKSDSTLALDPVDLRRAIFIDSWMEKHQHNAQSQPSNHDHDQKIRIVRQKSVPGLSPPSLRDHDYGDQTATPTTSSFTSKIRANLAPRSAENCFRFDRGAPSKRVVSSSRLFTKTKSRALKLYGDLRKPKQPPPPSRSPPVSPGGRIAAFLNSIFRNPGSAPARGSNPPSTSTCSSASSFSRSCLSKTPSSRGKSSSTSTGTKRSVRFYPVSVIVDEDSRPCGHKSLHKEDELPNLSNLSANKVNADENRKNQRKWRREKEIDTLMMMISRDCRDRRTITSFDCEDSDEEMNENDDGESCASSDLFELENLSSIGVGRYSEELPVYGTTSLQNLTS